MKLKVIDSSWVTSGFGTNRWMRVELEGFGQIEAFRQGLLGIWACPARTKLSKKQAAAFDSAMDAAWEEEQWLKSCGGPESA